MFQSLQKNKTALGIVIAIFVAIVFGLYPSLVRAVYNDGANISAIIIIGTLARFLGLYALASIQGHKVFSDQKLSKIIIVAGICQGLSVIGVLGGIYFLPGAVVIIIMFSASLMLLLYSSYIGEYSLNAINISLTFMTLIGLAMVLDIGSAHNADSLYGYLLALLAAVTTAIRAQIFATEGQNQPPSVVGAQSFFIASLCVLGLLLYEFPVMPESSYGYGMLMAACVSMILGTCGMFYGFAYLGAYRYSMAAKLEPICTTLFGILIVNDLLSPLQYIGIAIVVGSLIALNVFDRQKK